jgi:hypothetical protein
MINKDKLTEYIAAFRRPPVNPSIELLNEIKAELDKVSIELMRTQMILINISNALGVETKDA